MEPKNTRQMIPSIARKILRELGLSVNADEKALIIAFELTKFHKLIIEECMTLGEKDQEGKE